MYMTHEGKALKQEFKEAAEKQWKGDALAADDIQIEVNFYFKDKRRRDWDNYHKILMDALTGIVWLDDSQIFRATVTKYVDKDDPRTEIYVI